MPITPTSIRLPDDLLAQVDAWAEAHGYSRTGALVQLVARGLGGGEGREDPLVGMIATAGLYLDPARREQLRAALEAGLREMEAGRG